MAVSSDEEEVNGSLYVFGSARGLQAMNLTYLLADAVFGRWGLRVSNDSVLTIDDLDHDGSDDLAVGSPENCPSDEELDSCGAIGILPGSAHGLTRTGAYVWDQDTPGAPGQVRSTDRFASTISAGDLDRDGFADLAISAQACACVGPRKRVP